MPHSWQWLRLVLMNFILFDFGSELELATKIIKLVFLLLFFFFFLWPRPGVGDVYFQFITLSLYPRHSAQILLLLIRLRVFQFAGPKREIKSATAFDSASKCLLLTWSSYLWFQISDFGFPISTSPLMAVLRFDFVLSFVWSFGRFLLFILENEFLSACWNFNKFGIFDLFDRRSVCPFEMSQLWSYGISDARNCYNLIGIQFFWCRCVSVDMWVPDHRLWISDFVALLIVRVHRLELSSKRFEYWVLMYPVRGQLESPELIIFPFSQQHCAVLY